MPGDRAVLQPVSLLSLPAKCELDTDRFLPQSGFLLDKQDPGQAHAIIIHLGKTGHVAFDGDIL